ncbi:hypothetical protein KUW19_00165 [Ferrimonas balearica]|uniref:hypothetical protein n=1 Tax=Ferrimonas balearica TaxID=44012 RepID=UPI001C93F4D0|nr:hypothetical protein [Ferrimonas balearica]MBY6104895.1 hypothetical protein [Ferrimonas balearica]
MQLEKSWVRGGLDLLLIIVALAFFGLVATSAFAADAVADDVVIEPILIGLFGAQPWIMWVGIALAVWAHLRPHIPADWLAKLPEPVIKVLDWLAGNYRHASNSYLNDPIDRKQFAALKKG